MAVILPIHVPQIPKLDSINIVKTETFMEMIGGKKMDINISEYLAEKRDIIDLTPEVANFVAKFEALKNVTEATISIPKTLMNMQI